MRDRGERIRVLRLIARLNVGGPAIQATLLTERLDPARYECRLVCGAEGPSEGNYLSLQGKSLDGLIVLPALGRDIQPWRDLAVLGQLIALIRKVRPHIVHTHTAKAGALGRLAAWLMRVPVVVHTYHGHVFSGYFSATRTRVFLAIERWLAARTDRLLAVSDRVHADLLDLGVGAPGRLEVLPLGLDLDRFCTSERARGQVRAELGISSDAALVGIVARLVPIKAHEVFLQAAARLLRDVPSAHFLVVGGGERRRELEALASDLGLGSRVRFLGWRQDLDRIYADLDVVALCSRNEGSPVSLIEAMAAGKPVVATRVGGVPDLVEDGVTGCLVPPGDAEGLASAIRDLIASPDARDAMGRAGRKRVVPAFGAERLLEDVDRLYTSLLQEKLGQPRIGHSSRAGQPGIR